MEVAKQELVQAFSLLKIDHQRHKAGLIILLSSPSLLWEGLITAQAECQLIAIKLYLKYFIYYKIPEENRSTRNSAVRSSYSRKKEAEKKLYNPEDEDIPVEILARQDRGFDSMRHVPYHSRYSDGGPQVTAGGLKEQDFAKNIVTNFINDTKQSMQDNLNSVSQKAGLTGTNGDGLGDITRQFGHDIKSKTEQIRNSVNSAYSDIREVNPRSNSGTQSYEINQIAPQERVRTQSYTNSGSSWGQPSGQVYSQIPNQIEHRVDQGRTLAKPMRIAANKVSDYTRDKYDSVTQVLHPISEGFKASGREVADRTMEKLARAEPYVYPIAHGMNVAGHEIKEKAKEKKENVKDSAKKFLAFGKLIGETISSRANEAAARYGLDVSDAAVLLVASAVLSMMMLVITWLLIRQ